MVKYSKVGQRLPEVFGIEREQIDPVEAEELRHKLNDVIAENNAALSNLRMLMRDGVICVAILGILITWGFIIFSLRGHQVHLSSALSFSSVTPPVIPSLAVKLSTTASLSPSLSPSSSPSLSTSLSTSLSPSSSPSLSPSLSTTSSLSKSLEPVPSPPVSTSTSLTPTKSLGPAQAPFAVVYEGKVWWDGKYDTFPEPVSAEFQGPPAPEAIGKKAYMTMISGFGEDNDQYSCLGLTLMTSIQKTNPDPSIDRLVIVLISDYDQRYQNVKEGTPEFEKITPEEVLGTMFYNAYLQAGVNKWVIWKELDTEGREGMVAGWKQAFSKLKFWSLVQYEKIVFLDADTMVLKNLDHLFSEPDFTTAPTWNCKNANSPLKPSGGFWVFQPSANIWGLIQKYIQGRDPCANKWRLGDMTMTWVLFTDVSYLTEGTAETWQRFDGDLNHYGRCQEKNMYPARYDFITSNPGSYNQREGVIPPTDRWRMLNESYDVLVPICDDIGFYWKPTDDRYNFLRGKGKEKFDRPDAFSVHFSCGHKPRCQRHHEEYNELAACARDMWDQWYKMLYVYYGGQKS